MHRGRRGLIRGTSLRSAPPTAVHLAAAMGGTESGGWSGGSASFAIRPNRSLPVTGLVVLFVGLSALPVTIGVGFAIAGVWMVLPFAALEVAFLGALIYWLYRHVDDGELIVIDTDRVRVTQRVGTREHHYEFQRHWLRVELEPGRTPREPSRLCLGSHGRSLEVGNGITDDDRQRLAAALRQALHGESGLRPRGDGETID